MKDERIYCICSGKELKRRVNGNGQSKEKRKDAILYKGLCELSYISEGLKSTINVEAEEEVNNAIKVIEKMRGEIKKINEEDTDNKKGEGELSGHHPAKKAICGQNGLIVPIDRSIHTRLENNNISPAEAKVLILMFPAFIAMNAVFFLNGGRDLSEREMVDILMRELMNLRKIPQKTLRVKLMEKHSPEFYAEKAANMLKSRGVDIDRFRRAN